jgi:hypothetical protein
MVRSPTLVKILVLISLVTFIGVLSVDIVSATNCWEYDFTDQTTCEAAGTGDDCQWDSWGSWCMEKGCWDFWTQDACNAEENISGCFWQTESDMGWAETGWCEEAGACWNYNQSACGDASGCLWKSAVCGGPPGCESLTAETECQDSYLGCWWDNGDYCYKPGCWDYRDSGDCDDASCEWRANAYCTETGGGCWSSNNQTVCEATSGCIWESYGDSIYDGYCNKKQCWHYNSENSTTCEADASGKCAWREDGDYCYEKGCWQYWNAANCTANPDSLDSGCEWAISGSCNSPSCPSFSDNETACNTSMGCTWDNTSTYNDACTYEGCWNFNNENACNETTSCYWKAQSCSGSTGCEDLTDRDSCQASSLSCWWDNGDYCTDYQCWNPQFSTDQTACETTADDYNLDCQWDSYWNNCYDRWCGSYTVEADCNASTSGDCYWENGWCQEEGCWGFNDDASCTAKGCTWDADWGWCQEPAASNCYDLNETSCTNTTFENKCKWEAWGSGHCSDRGCWDYQTNSTCGAANLSSGTTCEWTVDTGGWCEDPGVQCWDHYDEGNCTYNNCTWDSSYNSCMEKGCWQYWTNATCDTDSTCEWLTSASAGWDWGWCEKRACWNFDNTDQSSCESNSYNLTCTWDGGGGGMCHGPWQNNCWQNETWNGGSQADCEANNISGENCTWQTVSGWCYEAAKDFTDFTTEGDCLASGWGKWNGTDCEIKEDVTDMENPGCWIFDGQPEECNAVQGCTYDSSTLECDGAEQIFCGNITSYIVNNQTNQTLCEAIPMLSTCCKWQGGNCNITYATSCWDQMAEAPEGGTHCMDYNAIDNPTICEQIAGDPWYMPCVWSNTTNQCGFKGDMATNVEDIKTKKNCEFLGGTWRVESVCGTSDCSETKSWCEMDTGGSVYGCDASCWACNSSSTCTASKKGYCVWSTDANLDQGGYCDIPEGLVLNGDCDVACGSCEFYNSGDYTPEEACGSSQNGCKWDNATETCINDNARGCADDCFYCFDITECNNNGGGSSGTCKWDDYEGMCMPSNFDGEICFDGSDNDGDNQIDCSDNDCMFDPFCGGGSMGDCWSYYDNDTCIDSNCSWFLDPWSQQNRCGMNGENCWIYESNQTGCDADNDCNWFNEEHCEINHTKSDNCFTKTTQTGCESVNGSYCTWTADEYSPQSGWCDFAPFQCGWNSTLQRSKTDCEGNSFCAWVTDPWGGSSWCEPKCFARDANGDDIYNTEAGCNAAISGGLCSWSGGWCEPNSTAVGITSGDDCSTYDTNMTACEEQQGCMWFEQMMMGFDDGPGGGGFFHSECDERMEVSCRDFANASYCNASYQNGTFTDNYATDGNSCRWVTEGSWAWCEHLGMHCGPAYAPFNQTTGQPVTDTTACNADQYCMVLNDTYGGGINICMGICHNSSLTNQTACEAAGTGDFCIWEGEGAGSGEGGSGGGGTGPEMGGWCDPAGAQHFEQMEGGRPQEIAMDECGESGIDDWTDACFLGIKEMTDNYGIGIGLEAMTYAAVCNGENLWDGSTGSGRKATKGWWYLDTDGNETNNCNSDDGNSTGYEFKLIADWSWSDSGLSESLSAKRCLNSSWTAAKVRLDTHKKKMCSEMQGMFVTIDIEDLTKVPNLFDSSKPMRIYATTGGANNTASAPIDRIGPGYYKPGEVDFKIEDCNAIGNVDMDADGFFAYEDPDCKSKYLDEDKGFKLIEDCVSAQDDDMNGLVNCDDNACKDEVVCSGTLEPDATDHEAPEIRETKEKEKKYGASIEYTTDERSNGTTYFYGTDSSCGVLNATIRDKGIWDENENGSNYTKFGFKHKAPIDNFTHTDALDYGLVNATTYFYKVEVCDISGNCAKTGCLNFTTKAATQTKTMKFSDPDSGESWLMDKNGTGAFAAQGSACTLNTGSNSSLGELIDPEESPEIHIQQNQTTDNGTISVAIGGIDSAASQSLDNLDMDVGQATGGVSDDTEDYVWMNESGWGGEDGVYTHGAPDNVTIILPGNDPDLYDCQSIIAGVLSNCTNITSYADRTYDEDDDATTWVIHNPGSDLWSYIVAQTLTGEGSTSGVGGTSGASGAAAAVTTNTTDDTNETTTSDDDDEEDTYAPPTGAATGTGESDSGDGVATGEDKGLPEFDLNSTWTYIILAIVIIAVVALMYPHLGGGNKRRPYPRTQHQRINRPTTRPKTFTSHRNRVRGSHPLENYGFKVKRK